MANIDFRNSTNPIDGRDVCKATVNERPMFIVVYTNPKTGNKEQVGLIMFRAGPTKVDREAKITITGETIHKLARRYVPSRVKEIEVISNI